MKTAAIIFLILAVAMYIWSASISSLEDSSYVQFAAIVFSVLAAISVLWVVLA
jgi:hypothetical protein